MCLTRIYFLENITLVTSNYLQGFFYALYLAIIKYNYYNASLHVI